MLQLTIHILLICVLYNEAQGEMYTTKWDNINVDEILKSDRLLANYKKCLMDQGSCSPDAKELKRDLPEALQNDCHRCSAKQKENTEKVVKFLIDERPEMWKELEERYDPEHIFYNKHYNTTETST